MAAVSQTDELAFESAFAVMAGPGAELAQPTQWQERETAWAAWAYETVTQAMNQFGEQGSFMDILTFFAAKRQELALAYRSHEARLFGVWRDERLDPSLRMRTTFFGSKPYARAGEAYQQLLGMGVDSHVQGMINGHIGADVYQLTSFRYDARQTDPRGRMWLHTHWRNITPIMNHCRELFEMALEPIDDTAALSLAAQLHWWFVHALPFARGSTSIAEWLVAYICRTHGAGNVKFYEDPAALAWVAPGTRLYEPAFRANLALIPGRVTTKATRSASRQLAHAARTGATWRLRKLLRSTPATTREPTGYTALHLAAREGHVGAVKILLGAGAQPETTLHDVAQTPLHLAARSGHGRIVGLLLGAGASVDSLDDEGCSALHWAVRGNHYWTAWRLLRSGASPRAADALGRMPLHYASERGFVRLVQLLTHGAQRISAASHADRRGETPLSLAALTGHDKVVAVLLARGAPPPTQDLQLLAIKVGHKTTERRVLEAGVDPSMYWLLRRTAKRGHMLSVGRLREQLLGMMPKKQRRMVQEMLALPAPTPPKPETDILLDQFFDISKPR